MEIFRQLVLTLFIVASMIGAASTGASLVLSHLKEAHHSRTFYNKMALKSIFATAIAVFLAIDQATRLFS